MNVVEKTQIANGFTALNCEDGFRKDNRLWFGECSECGERITNSHFDGVWKHTVYSEKGFYSKEKFDEGIFYNQSTSRQVDYCPKVEGKEVAPIVWYLQDGVKVYA
jgi:hypothetical protein